MRNESEAIVTKITELDYVLRFLILGQTELSYVPVGGGQLKTKDETKVRIDIETYVIEQILLKWHIGTCTVFFFKIF